MDPPFFGTSFRDSDRFSGPDSTSAHPSCYTPHMHEGLLMHAGFGWPAERNEYHEVLTVCLQPLKLTAEAAPSQRQRRRRRLSELHEVIPDKSY